MADSMIDVSVAVRAAMGQMTLRAGTIYGTRVVLSGNKVATSDNCFSWTTSSNYPAVNSNNSSGQIAYGAGKFVIIVGQVAYYSSDKGATWTFAPSFQHWTGASAYGIAFNGSVFCAVGGNGNSICLTSPDGVNWTKRTGISTPLASGSTPKAIYANGSTFYAVTTYFSTNQLIKSTDNGVTWTLLPSFQNLINQSLDRAEVICAYGSTIVCGGQSFLAISTNSGSTWTRCNVPNSKYDITGIGVGNGKFVVLTRMGYIYKLNSQNQWVSVSSNFYGQPASGVIYDGVVIFNASMGKWFIGGGGGQTPGDSVLSAGIFTIE